MNSAPPSAAPSRKISCSSLPIIRVRVLISPAPPILLEYSPPQSGVETLGLSAPATAAHSMGPDNAVTIPASFSILREQPALAPDPSSPLTAFHPTCSALRRAPFLAQRCILRP